MVERKYYDLTPSQKLMYFALKFIPEKNVVNIGTAVWFHENIDCELLKAAAYKAIWRMDALRLRLKKVKGQIKQYVSEEELSASVLLFFDNKNPRLSGVSLSFSAEIMKKNPSCI